MPIKIGGFEIPPRGKSMAEVEREKQEAERAAQQAGMEKYRAKLAERHLTPKYKPPAEIPVEQTRFERPSEVSAHVNGFYDQWSERLRDNDVFVLTRKEGEDLNPLQKLFAAKEKAVALSKEIRSAITKGDAAERTARQDELIALLNEMNTDLADELEAAVAANEEHKSSPIRTADATPKELETAQRDAVDEIEMIRERSAALADRAGVGKERAAAAAALEARKPVLKEFLKAEAEFKKLKKPTAEQTEEYNRARLAYESANNESVSAQLAYVTKLQESSKARILEKGIHKGLREEESAALLARYNRLVRVKEIVIPAKNQETEVREELLNEKGRNIFQRTLKLNQDLTKRIQAGAESLILKTSWGKKMDPATIERTARIAGRAARLVGFAAIGTTAGAAASVLLGGPAAAAIIAAAGGRIALGAANTATGAVAGYGLGKRFEATKGRKRAEAFNALQEKDIATEADLQEQRSAEALGSAEAIRKGRIKRENIGAMAVSLGLSAGMLAEAGGIEAIKHAVTHLWSVVHGENPGVMAADIDVEPYVGTPAGPAPTFTYPDELKGFGPDTHADTIQPLGQEYFAQHPGIESGTAPGPGNTEALAIGAKLGKVKVDTADKLLGHFREQLAKGYAGKPMPAGVKEFLNHGEGIKNEDAFSKLFGFEDKNGASPITMHPGDTIRVEKGAVIFHTASGDHTLVDAQGRIHAMSPAETQAPSALEAPHAAAAPTEHAEVAQPAPAASNTGVEHSLSEQQPIPSDSPQLQYEDMSSVHNSEQASPSAADTSIAAEAPASIHDALNTHATDLSKPAVLMDEKSHSLFAHIVRTADPKANSEQAYALANDYAMKHPGTIVYYVRETKKFFGGIDSSVHALKFDPSAGDKFPVPLVSDSATELHVMPPIPEEANLVNPT